MNLESQIAKLAQIDDDKNTKMIKLQQTVENYRQKIEELQKINRELSKLQAPQVQESTR